MDKIFLSEPKILTFATIFFTLLPLLTLNGSHPMSVSHQHVRPPPLSLLAVFLGKGALLYVASVIILLCRYVCFSLFIINFLPYLAIYPFGEKGEHGLWHSVAAATVGAGHRHGIYRGLPFDVHGPECVTADITFECCYSSMHTCFFAANILFIIIRVKFIKPHHLAGIHMMQNNNAPTPHFGKSVQRYGLYSKYFPRGK